MDVATYAVEAEVEETHWWFVGRRQLFSREIRAMKLASNSAILDVGTSTGTNLRMLGDLAYDNVIGLDQSPEAIHFCQSKGLGMVKKGDICAMPFDDNHFNLVLATDVVEHVDDDAGALREIARVLKPGGSALITVPTFQVLWGLQDDISHHKRRYRKSQMLKLVEEAGLEPKKDYYFNYILFVPIWLARRMIDLFNVKVDSEGEIGSPVINRILNSLFAVDIKTAPFIRPPFGVSALVIAQKPVHQSGSKT